MAKEKITGAEAMMRSLEYQGVKTLFGYPGGSIMPTFDALYHHRNTLNHILVRHEQGAAHAAQGFARVSGEVGVCLVTSGPGATNTITGIADAMIDSTPIVVIAGQVGASFLGTDAFQEVDLVGITQPITKWSYQIRRAEDVAWAVARAFYIAKSGRPGPVVLDFAKNAQAEMVDYARGKFRLSAEKPSTLETSLYSSVDIISPYSTPWRVIMAAERLVDLINHNDLALNLNTPCRISDISWIKPGKVFRSGDLKQEKVKAAIDFAAERGIQYVHMDAGWYGPEMKMSSDATTVSPDKDLDISALCKYAESKGIGLMVYVNQRALVQQLDSLLPLYKKWGLKGIKFGFVQIGNQHWSTWLHDAVRKCAEYEMMVDIHDEYRPTGFSRTYPNLMTQEGIRGNEEMPDATHNTILPYTRFLAGAGDYTLCYFNSRVKNTKAHQLAMAAVYYSPLQFMFWYDNPAMYKGEEELEFWKAIPTVWDESRALDGEIGEYIVQARRSGKEWFVGAMTNTEARTITLTTDFLKPGTKYIVNLYEDDDKLNTRTKVRTTHKKIKAGDKLTLKLKSSGGAALHFTLAE